MNVDYYAVLGLPRYATREELQLAFEKLSWKNHPDKAGDSLFYKQLQAASGVLRDPRSRERYDILGQFYFASKPSFRYSGDERIGQVFMTAAVQMVTLQTFFITFFLEGDLDLPISKLLIPTFLGDFFLLYGPLFHTSVSHPKVGDEEVQVQRQPVTFFYLRLSVPHIPLFCAFQGLLVQAIDNDKYSWLEVMIPLMIIFLVELFFNFQRSVNSIFALKKAVSDLGGSPPGIFACFLLLVGDLLIATALLISSIFVALKMDESVDWSWQIIFIPLHISLWFSWLSWSFIHVSRVTLFKLFSVKFDIRHCFCCVFALSLVFLYLLSEKCDGGTRSWHIVFSPIYILLILLSLKSYEVIFSRISLSNLVILPIFIT